MKFSQDDLDALQQLEDESHGYVLQRYSRSTNAVDLSDIRLREYASQQPEIGNTRSKLGIDIYACKVGRKQRQFGRTIAEAVKAAIKGTPLSQERTV